MHRFRSHSLIQCFRQKTAKKATAGGASRSRGSNTTQYQQQAQEGGRPTETTGLVSGIESSDTNDELSRLQKDYRLPPRSCVYSLFVLFSGLAVLVTGMMILSQVLNLALSRGAFIQDILRVYVLILCILFLLSELQFERFLKLVPPLRNWIYRGFLYSLVGIIGVEESVAALAEQYPKVPRFEEEMASLFLKVTSYCMFGIGVLYMAMGILCLKSVWEKLKNSYDEQVKNRRTSDGEDTSLIV